jgi:2-methylcitrate dehydratase PrpD
MDNLTPILATFAAALTYDRIPSAILHQARRSLVDTLGRAFVGRDCEAARMGRRIAAGTRADLDQTVERRIEEARPRGADVRPSNQQVVRDRSQERTFA